MPNPSLPDNIKEKLLDANPMNWDKAQTTSKEGICNVSLKELLTKRENVNIPKQKTGIKYGYKVKTEIRKWKLINWNLKSEII